MKGESPKMNSITQSKTASRSTWDLKDPTSTQQQKEASGLPRVNGAAKGAAISSFAGVTSGLLGVGGGIIKVAAMNLFMNVPLKRSRRNKQVHDRRYSGCWRAIFFVTGLVNVYVLAPIALGTTLGATLGTSIMSRLQNSV